MLLSSLLISCTLLISTTTCQFLYNYEQPELEDTPADDQTDDSSLYHYNPPLAANQKFQRLTSHDRDTTQRSHNRDISRTTESVKEVTEIPETPADVPTNYEEDRPRRTRKIRRRQRIQSSGQIPEISYSPSIFENIGLGEAPNGVFVPQDSLLNLLKNPSQRTFQNYQPQITFQNYEPQQSFFVQPPETYDVPSVVYSNADMEDGTRRTKPRNRQKAQRTEFPSSVVDIDSYISHPDDIVKENVAIIPQVRDYKPSTSGRSAQGRSAQRQAPLSRANQDYSSSYHPSSSLQNSGSWEAPEGVYIPEDSLLNALRNPSYRTRSTYRIADDQPDPLSADADHHPSDSDQSTSSVGRNSQQSRHLGTSRRTVPNRTGYDRRTVERSQQIDAYSTDRESKEQLSRQDRKEKRKQVHTSRGQPDSKPARLSVGALPEDTDGDEIPGEAGRDYPTLHSVPKTQFLCSQQQHNGYYADVETACQVVHFCQARGVKNSFLCPNGTIFNQEKFSCQWWYEVDCADAPRFYSNNDALYKVPTKKPNKE